MTQWQRIFGSMLFFGLGWTAAIVLGNSWNGQYYDEVTAPLSTQYLTGVAPWHINLLEAKHQTLSERTRGPRYIFSRGDFTSEFARVLFPPQLVNETFKGDLHCGNPARTTTTSPGLHGIRFREIDWKFDCTIDLGLRLEATDVHKRIYEAATKIGKKYRLDISSSFRTDEVRMRIVDPKTASVVQIEYAFFNQGNFRAELAFRVEEFSLGVPL